MDSVSRRIATGIGLIIALIGAVVLGIFSISKMTELRILEPAPATFATATPSPRAEFSSNVPVLMYHYIRIVENPEEDKLGFNLSVTPENFDQQMKYIHDNGYNTITPDELYNSLKTEQPLPPKSILITFDDGYIDFYLEAFPVLKKYNLKATAYIVTGFLNDDQNRYLTWNQVKELDQSGLVTIAAHTLHHSNVATSQNAQKEISESKIILEKFLGHPVTSFAYPGGTFNDTAATYVAQAKYNTAFTTQLGTTMKLSNQYTLPRIRISGYAILADFAKKLDATISEQE